MSDYETQARRRKAVALSDYCRAHNITARWVTEMTATERREVCSLAFVNLASDETWAIVVGLLGAYEDMHPAIAAALPSDPFEGLS